MLIAVEIYISVCPQCQSQKVRPPSYAAIFNTSEFLPRAKQLSTTMCNVILLTFDCGHQRQQKEFCRPPCDTTSGWAQHKPGKCSEFEPARSTNGIEDVRLCHRAGLPNDVFDTQDALALWEGTAAGWLQRIRYGAGRVRQYVTPDRYSVLTVRV